MTSRTAIGYHGTTLSGARAILQERRFKMSEGDYHWLGPGIYFWQDAPLRAWEWALYKARNDQDKSPPAVVSAEIELSNILDLTDIGSEGLLRETYRSINEECQAHEGWQQSPEHRPTQRAPAFQDAEGRFYLVGGPDEGPPKYNRLDHAVIDRLCQALWTSSNYKVNSVRCAFAEGRMVYPSSYIFNRNHVQIAVLEPSVILSISLEDTEALAAAYADKVLSWRAENSNSPAC